MASIVSLQICTVVLFAFVHLHTGNGKVDANLSPAGMFNSSSLTSLEKLFHLSNGLKLGQGGQSIVVQVVNFLAEFSCKTLLGNETFGKVQPLIHPGVEFGVKVVWVAIHWFDNSTTPGAANSSAGVRRAARGYWLPAK